jgi:LDH2 family malate/lactate/ureidoglycolate dehydrogenase
VARIGRPPIDGEQASVGVQVRLPTRTFDRLYERAQREGVTMPEVLRRALDRELRQDERDEDE